jgi:hypothetical protein
MKVRSRGGLGKLCIEQESTQVAECRVFVYSQTLFPTTSNNQVLQNQARLWQKWIDEGKTVIKHQKSHKAVRSRSSAMRRRAGRWPTPE